MQLLVTKYQCRHLIVIWYNWYMLITLDSTLEEKQLRSISILAATFFGIGAYKYARTRIISL